MIDHENLLRELHHRVKNNFQIIASLINLQKRSLPRERRRDLRFIEEHVQAMAIAYRVVWAADNQSLVSLVELVSEVVETLKTIADCPNTLMSLDLAPVEKSIGLDQAIALSQYLAVVVPPLIDRAMGNEGGGVVISLRLTGNLLTLTLAGNGPAPPVARDPLRARLAAAYLHQLNASEQPNPGSAGQGIKFVLEAPPVDVI